MLDAILLLRTYIAHITYEFIKKIVMEIKREIGMQGNRDYKKFNQVNVTSIAMIDDIDDKPHQN